MAEVEYWKQFVAEPRTLEASKTEVTDVLKVWKDGEKDTVVMVDEDSRPIGVLDEAKVWNHIYKEKSLNKKIKDGWILEVSQITEGQIPESWEQQYPPIAVVNKKGKVTGVWTEKALKELHTSETSSSPTFRPSIASFRRIIGENEEVHRAIQIAKRAAKTKTPVWLSGETGTGKELFAQAIHQESGRTGEFIAVNCASIPDAHLEEELFGKEVPMQPEYGAVGLLEAAHEGTLFLDEVGNMSMAMQAALLRVLEDSYVRKVGNAAPIPVNMKIISATNENIEQLVEEGRFRRDLYYRLHVIAVSLPPLRDRIEDLPLLVEYYNTHFSTELGVKPLKITNKAMEAMKQYGWPGNIRELMNVIEQLAAMHDGGKIRTEDLPLPSVTARESAALAQETKTERTGAANWKDQKSAQEQAMIKQALEEANGNKTEAAKKLGIHRTTLYKKMRDHQM
ncbi:sigma-54 interaction domain-containing protein [Marinococcus halophilus]|uniref:sigma-54 interaction domain-containing protein n=1 Tax=Marinococcus halophilus TaxID=1371 RepID=UPI0009A8E068|nr:sigma 54-interacting transcriptional regulator [Marinococcus halophilus]